MTTTTDFTSRQEGPVTYFTAETTAARAFLAKRAATLLKFHGDDVVSMSTPAAKFFWISALSEGLTCGA